VGPLSECDESNCEGSKKRTTSKSLQKERTEALQRKEAGEEAGVKAGKGSRQHSRAFQRFIDQADSLLHEAIAAGNAPSAKAPIMELLEKLLPKMREEEKDEVPKYFLKVAHEMGEELAQAGYPLPGNDPKKPN
jgi:hypothetical protein